MAAKQNREPKARDAMTLMMILHRKGGAHKDRKAEARRLACRGKRFDD